MSNVKVYQPSELAGFNNEELRRMLRKLYPETRGNFSASRKLQECIDLLCGKADVAQEIKNWEAGKAQSKPKDDDLGIDAADAVASLSEGDHGKAEADKYNGVETKLTRVQQALKGMGSTMADDLDEVGKTLLAQHKEKVSLTNQVAELAKKAAEAVVKVPSQFKLSGDGKTGKLCGVNLPMGDASLPSLYGKLDDKHDFSMFRASLKAGAMTFKSSWSEVVDCAMDGDNVLMIGPPGVGKTSCPNQTAARMNWPVVEVGFHNDLQLPDVVGSSEAADGKTFWVDGPLCKALRIAIDHPEVPVMLILDEIDHAPAEFDSVMHSVTNRTPMTVVANKGEVLDIGPNLIIVATMNTAGFGDDSGLHPNAKIKDCAFLSRFQTAFHVDWPAPDKERRFLKTSTGCSAEVAQMIVAVAKDCRDAVENGELQYPVTMRHTKAWARRSVKLGVGKAFGLCVLGKAPQSDRAVLVEIAQRHLGAKLEGQTEKSAEGN